MLLIVLVWFMCCFFVVVICETIKKIVKIRIVVNVRGSVERVLYGTAKC